MIAIVLAANQTVARDLDSLAKFVIPAYTAMNFAMLCAQDDPDFLARISGLRGTVLHYAEHVKEEAIDSLSHEEAASVLKQAADEARTEARREIEKLTPSARFVEVEKLLVWCRNNAEQFVRAFIERHDQTHAVLLRDLERSKR